MSTATKPESYAKEKNSSIHAVRMGKTVNSNVLDPKAQKTKATRIQLINVAIQLNLPMVGTKRILQVLQ